MKLVFVHGRAQEDKDHVTLQETWEATLCKGFAANNATWPDDVEVAFPYYGNKLAGLVKQVEAPTVADVIERGLTGADKQDPAARFRAEMLTEIAENAGITKQEILEHFDGPAVERGPENWGWVQAILKALDKTPVGGKALDWFTRDVYVYLEYDVVRESINAIVRAAIGDGPCLVVSHSLGTVVAYDVLRNMQGAGDWLHVTVGSPLGLKAIKSRLGGVLGKPPPIGRWYNAYDEADVVALHPLDTKHFPIGLKPPIVNNNGVRNDTENRHGIVGYLNDKDVASVIHSALS